MEAVIQVITALLVDELSKCSSVSFETFDDLSQLCSRQSETILYEYVEVLFN